MSAAAQPVGVKYAMMGYIYIHSIPQTRRAVTLEMLLT
jgi:hypothetical protein